MKSKYIKVASTNDILELVHRASSVDGDVTVTKGRYVVDAKSFLGVTSLCIEGGATIEYPEDAVEFEKYISQFEV